MYGLLTGALAVQILKLMEMGASVCTVCIRGYNLTFSVSSNGSLYVYYMTDYYFWDSDTLEWYCV
jgi:hypothetical protein